MSTTLPLRLLLLVHFLLITATGMSQPYWPIILASNHWLTHDQIVYWSGCIYLAPLVMAMIFSPLWGRFADQYGYRLMLMRSAFALLIIQGALMLSAAPIYVLICRILQGMFSGCIAASQALGVRLTEPEKAGMVIAKIQSATALGTLIGPVISSIIFLKFHYQILFSVSCGLCCISVIIIGLGLFEPKQPPIQKNPSNAINHRYSIQTIKIYITIFLAQSARMMLIPIFAFFITKTLLLHQAAVGILYAASGASLFLFSPIISSYDSKHLQQRYHTQALIAIALLLGCLVQCIMATATQFYELLILRLLFGLALAGILPCLFSLSIRINSIKNRGFRIGLANSFSKLGNLCGITLSTALMPWVNIRTIILISSMIYLLTFLFSLFNAVTAKHADRLKATANQN